ncbi:MAG: hypothetical protein KDE14_08535 [Rhodobacteraceae bacterium]|nr:hypothetical protein [Paracoccaceae bacterium]
MSRLLAILILANACFQSISVHAEVVRIEILDRTPYLGGRAFGDVGAYEQLTGRMTYAVDPNADDNKVVADVANAPRDAGGKVVFSADFMILKPIDPARANGRLLYEVNNRGGVGSLGFFNDAASALRGASKDEQAGNGFLFEQGYTLVSSGWTWDVPPGPNRLRADLPTATVDGRAVTGAVTGEIAVTRPTESAQHIGMLSVGYAPVDLGDPSAVLTKRDHASDTRRPIPRDRWRFGRNVDGVFYPDPAWITLEGGFTPGAIYNVTYTAREPRVVGLGLIAIRDTLLFLRGARRDAFGGINPLTENGGDLPTTVIGFGISQSGRLLSNMLLLGLTGDASGRRAMDGLFIHVAGGGKGSFNYRFAQSSRHFSPDVEMDYPTDFAPFSTASVTDPLSGTTSNLFDRAISRGTIPKVFFVNTSAEYWARAASLIHTTHDGAEDVAPHPSARLYFVAGGQHGAASSGSRRNFSACRNPLDYRPMMRALLLQLDAWVTQGREPEPTTVPRLADNQLTDLTAYVAAFPEIPAARTPVRFLEPPRLDFGPRFDTEGIADIVPPKPGPNYVTRVPVPDADGIDQGGLRMPEVSVPLGTYTGWNLQNADTGAPERLGRWDGSFFPFARDENERIATRDSRISIAERYATRDDYVRAVAEQTLLMAERELILGADVNPLIERAGRFYDRVTSHDPSDESCDYIVDR